MTADDSVGRPAAAGEEAALADPLTHSVEWLERTHPQLSARQTWSARARWYALATGGALLVLLVVTPVGALIALSATIVLLYLTAVGYKVALFRSSLETGALVQVSDMQARALTDDELPTYTVLVPMHDEPQVAEQMLRALRALEYPRHLLDVRILLEADDERTLRALLAVGLDPHVTIVQVPDCAPKTKPKACNYGVLGATGALLTIYDAEDVPDALQLLRAAAAFRRLPPDVACLQARLGFYNPRQNLLTRWFAIDYGMWFTLLLPGLIRLGAPVPLGGTSLHIRRDVLDAVGRWDPFNVTEDADLGIRLARYGHRVLVLDSVTLEEANSDFVNWVRQRSRWYKGYAQTFLVHMRDPRRLWREIGPRGVLGVTLFIGGTPLLSVLNPVMWALTLLWFGAQPRLLPQIFPGWVLLLGLVCWAVGNATCVYMGVVSAPVAGAPHLVGAALLMPVYWLMMSMAAVKAGWQLVMAPSFWEKTVHGLHQGTSQAPGQ
ncbi:MAG: glycosyltransferase family 2 protein [Egibacteraceae bacterium]